MTYAANILPYLVVIALFATAAILATGLVSMASENAIDDKYSNLLMRWRVVVQGITVGLAAVAFFVVGLS